LDTLSTISDHFRYGRGIVRIQFRYVRGYQPGAIWGCTDKVLNLIDIEAGKLTCIRPTGNGQA